MHLSLGKKLFFATGITVALILGGTLAVLELRQRGQWETHLEQQSISFAQFATPELLKRFRGEFTPAQGSDATIGLELLGINKDLISFAILAPGGRPLFVSPPFPDHIDEASSDPVDPLLSSDRGIDSRWSEEKGYRFFRVAIPAYGPTGGHLLTVHYLFSVLAIEQRIAEIRRQFLVVSIPAMMLVLGAAWLIASRISRPVRLLTLQADAIAAGDLSARVPDTSTDEIGRLGKSFNRMAEHLEQHRRELTEKNASLLSMQEQLIRSERLATIGQLAAGVSHEIDNPIGIILGHAELMQGDLPPGSLLQEDLQAIIDECRRCKKITGGLLGLARRAPAREEVFSPLLLIEEIISSLSPQKLFRRISISIKERSPSSLCGDQDQLRQVLINLLINAAQAQPEGGTIDISLSETQNSVSIDICDGGPGIPDTLQEKIFEPFFTTKPRGDGTGLGLALCRTLIEGMGGSIENLPSEKGGRFAIQLPLCGDADRMGHRGKML